MKKILVTLMILTSCTSASEQEPVLTQNATTETTNMSETAKESADELPKKEQLKIFEGRIQKDLEVAYSPEGAMCAANEMTELFEQKIDSDILKKLENKEFLLKDLSPSEDEAWAVGSILTTCTNVLETVKDTYKTNPGYDAACIDEEITDETVHEDVYASVLGIEADSFIGLKSYDCYVLAE